MGRIILLLLLGFCTQVFADAAPDCPADNALPATIDGVIKNLPDQMSCHVNLPDNKYAPCACEQYRKCIGSKNISPENFQAERQNGYKAIALQHANVLVRESKDNEDSFEIT